MARDKVRDAVVRVKHEEVVNRGVPLGVDPKECPSREGSLRVTFPVNRVVEAGEAGGDEVEAGAVEVGFRTSHRPSSVF